MGIPTDQNKLLQLASDHNKGKTNLAKTISSVLGISLNGAYKRINGVINFSLEEAAMLSKGFGFSLDQILPEKITRFNALFSGLFTEHSSMDYMDVVQNELEEILSSKDCKTWIVTNDLPDVYYYYFEELALLRYYIWERMGWKTKHLENIRFSFDLSQKSKILAKVKSLNALYQRMPTVEIWNYNMFHNISWQILYLAESGDFKDSAIPLTLCDRLGELLEHIRQMAKHRKRFIPGTNSEDGLPYQVYIHPSMQNHNIILVRSDNQFIGYPVLDNPNFMKITDPKITDYLHDLMDKFKRQSTSITNVESEVVKSFFDRASLQLEILREEVERLMNRRYL